MKRLHVSELTDQELSAVFIAAAAESVSRAKSAEHEVPSLKMVKTRTQKIRQTDISSSALRGISKTSHKEDTMRRFSEKATRVKKRTG